MTDRSSVTRKMITGSGWMVTLRMVDRLIGLASIAILARLLLPAQFGIVNMAVLLIGLLEIVSELNVEAALISDRHATKQHFDTAWTLNIIRGLVLAVALLLLAVPAASFFNEPAISSIVYWLALVPVISSLQNIGVIYFQKDLDFQKEFVFILSARLIATLVTIVLAFLWRDYWALVVGMITRSAVRVFLSYLMHSFRPQFSLHQFRKIFNYSKWMFLQHLISDISDRFPGLMLARTTGAEALAFFNIAYEIAQLATTELRAPVRRVLFPGFAKMATDPLQMVTTFKSAFGIMLLLSLPLPIGIGLTAPHLVRLFLGPNWMEAVPVLQVLAVFGVVMTLGTSSYVIYLATNRPRIPALFALAKFVVLLPLLFWWLPLYGAVGGAWALVVASLVTVVIDYIVILRLLKLHLLSLLSVAWRSLVAGTIMAATVAFLSSRFTASPLLSVTALQLGLAVIVGAIAYVSILALLWFANGRPPGPESQILGIVFRSRTNK